MMTTDEPQLAPVPSATLAAARMLTAADYLADVDDVLDFLAKPHKWETEVAAWHSAGRPLADDAGWELFLARLRRLEEQPAG